MYPVTSAHASSLPMAAERRERKKRCVSGSSRPTIPQSMTPIRPSRNSIMLPACTSPWKAPHRTVVRKNARMTAWTSGVGSIPSSATCARSSMGTPSKNSMVSTLRPENSGYGSGTAIIFEVELVLQPTEVDHGAGLVPQVHLLADLDPETVEQLQRGAGQLVPGQAHQYLHQRLHEVQIGGHHLFDVRPQHLDGHQRAVVEPGPVHHGDRRRADGIDARTRRRPLPAGDPDPPRPVWRTSGKGTSGPVSRQARNSSATSSPNMPGDEAMICPNFMKVPPRSSKLFRSGRANWIPGSAPWRMVRTCRRATGTKCRPTTLVIVELRRSQGEGARFGEWPRIDLRRILGERPRRRLGVRSSRGVSDSARSHQLRVVPHLTAAARRPVCGPRSGRRCRW